jgi:hypothetical protein
MWCSGTFAVLVRYIGDTIRAAFGKLDLAEGRWDHPLQRGWL